MQSRAPENRSVLRRTITAAVVAVAATWSVSSATAASIEGGVQAPTPDLFYNYYVPPVPANGHPGVGAQLYVTPRPVPPRVGHTWITYPPLMPHEFLYKHHRRWVRPYGATGFKTDTRAYWY